MCWISKKKIEIGKKVSGGLGCKIVINRNEVMENGGLD